MIRARLDIELARGVRLAFREIVREGEIATFQMGERGLGEIGLGSAEPQHRVTMGSRYWLVETPVTQAQFAVWTQAERVKHDNYFADHPDHPAGKVDWFQATRFCLWLTRCGCLPPGWMACLPTEAEWEYARRAGTRTEFHTGDGESALAEAGWFGERFDVGATHPVREKKANDFQLSDMHGNVWEWCHDEHDDHAYCRREEGVTDPGADGRLAGYADYLTSGGIISRGSNPPRVLRGGSWFNSARVCRSAFRGRNGADGRDRYIGLRVCLIPGPSAQLERGARESPAKPVTRAGGRGTRPQATGAGAAVAIAKVKRKPARIR